jgi:hypothetical protein
MQMWLGLILYSAAVGYFLAKFTNSKWSLVFAGLIPWLSLLTLLLYYEYFVPYQGGGASMWQVAQLFGGTVAAVFGLAAFIIVRVKERKL